MPLTLAQSLPLTGAVVVCTPQEVALLDATRAITHVPPAQGARAGHDREHGLLRRRRLPARPGRSRAQQLIESKGFFDAPGDERVYIFGRGGARRKAEELGVPFLGEVPLNIFLRETGDEGKIEQALSAGSPARPYLLGVVEQLAAQISIQNIKTPKMPKLEVIG